MRLLVVDDEEDICDTVAEIARARGFDVTTTSDPASVAGILSHVTPDLILLDLMMPGTDGVELLRLMVDQVKHAKICLMSGSDSRVLNTARRLGSAHGLDVIATLEKPIDITLLRGVLDQVSGGNSSVKAAETIDIAQAISSGQLVMHYQPIVEIATRRLKGVESLVRWEHPQQGLLQPDSFMDQVINKGLMPALTDWILNAAITQASAWHETGETFTVSMNVTATSLLELNLPDRIAELCKQKRLPPEHLVLEVTETEAMRDVTRTMDVLLRMRIRNIGVSIDDFGTGHSSLRELQRMPFSEMKIDKSFVTDMADNKDSAVIARSIIDLGHNLGLKIIAEGVESVRVWNLLAERHCDYIQGYYVSKPLPARAFNEWLVAWRRESD